MSRHLPRSPIVLQSPRERVARAAHYAFVLGGTLGGMAAAALASPVVLGGMSGAMLGLLLFIKVGLRFSFKQLEPYDPPKTALANVMCKRVGLYTRLLGLKERPFLKMMAGQKHMAVALQVGGKNLIAVDDVGFLSLYRPELKWTIAHEMAHCARRDFYQHMGLNGGLASAAGLFVGGIAVLASGFGVAAALPFIGGAAAQFCIPYFHDRKVRQIRSGAYTTTHVPFAELEAERVAASLLRTPCPADEFSYQISFQDMANHCARYDLPPPPHLPPPDQLPGRLTKAYNRLCGFLVRPLTAPVASPAVLRHSVGSSSFK